MSRWVMLFIGATLVAGSLAGMSTTSAATPQEDVNKAIALYNDGSYDKAVQLLQDAIKLNPRYDLAYLWLGVCYRKLGQNDQARVAFNKVISLAPNSPDAERAQAYLRSMVQLGPPNYLTDMLAVTGVSAGEFAPLRLFGVVHQKDIVGNGYGFNNVPQPQVTQPEDSLHPQYTWANKEWRIVYNLEGRFVRFRALAGVADGGDPGALAAFIVRGEGRVLFASNTMKVGQPPASIDVDVTGVSQLELVALFVDCCSRIGLVWADPAVYAPASSGQCASCPPPPGGATSGGPTGQIPSAPQSNGLPVVAVVDFADLSRSGWPNAAPLITDQVIAQLQQNHGITVLPRSQVEAVVQSARQQFGVATQGILSAVDAQKIGQALGATYVVMGEIDQLNQQSSNVNLPGISMALQSATVVLRGQVVDVGTDQIIAQPQGDGQTSGASTASVGPWWANVTTSNFTSQLIGKATIKAVNKFVSQFASKLEVLQR